MEVDNYICAVVKKKTVDSFCVVDNYPVVGFHAPEGLTGYVCLYV